MEKISSLVLFSCVLIFSTYALSARADDKCLKWFQQKKIAIDSSCLLKCATISVDMATFLCPNRCPDFCKTKYKEKLLFDFSYLYLGLTFSERALVSKYPKDSVKAFSMALDAEKICSKKYETALTGDVGDACRHFVWAVLLFDSFGASRAQEFLNAHEDDPTQIPEDKSMDLANNQLGLSEGQKIKTKGGDLPAKALDAFEQQLKKNSVVINKVRTQ